ncbi:MAG: hypothetical protein HY514_05395 [Candidatus Aenigmarchaeota archaeon]|nr:hypothetical protein [Candidatus Aenigmarchaeota archaeon]
MEINFIAENTIELNKELSILDKLALSAFPIVEKHAKYVIMSGYVAILFGRSRVSEDIDAFIERISYEKFCQISGELQKAGFWFVNSSDDKELFSMLEDDIAIRIAEHGKAIPNIEIKFPSEDLDFYTLDNPFAVFVNGKTLLVSKIEQQIAYKFHLGTEKDMEDAVYLYEIFKEQLNIDMLREYGNKLNVLTAMKKEGVLHG